MKKSDNSIEKLKRNYGNWQPRNNRQLSRPTGVGTRKYFLFCFLYSCVTVSIQSLPNEISTVHLDFYLPNFQGDYSFSLLFSKKLNCRKLLAYRQLFKHDEIVSHNMPSDGISVFLRFCECNRWALFFYL